jgi:FtsH-binding integral membrane protein
MKKKTIYLIVSWLFFLGGFVFSMYIIDYNPPTKLNLFFICTVFTACMLGFFGFREHTKPTYEQDFTLVLLLFIILVVLIGVH